MAHTHSHSNSSSQNQGFVLQVVLSIAALAVFATPVVLAALGI